MKILIDIGHPAHVHYFRNFYEEMQTRGHELFITARDKECTHELLDAFGMPYVNRGRGAAAMIEKIRYLVKADYRLYNYAKSVNPDLFLSFASPYAAQVSSLLGKPHIAFDDTEHASLAHLMYMPFTETICTPHTFNKDLGDKQVRFDGMMELAALHPNQFKPDSSVLELLGLRSSERYVLIRFVSWEASHDVGARGIPDDKKESLVDLLAKHGRVFISSEGALPQSLASYKIDIPAHKIHDALFYATLLIGEGATMAAESVLLGTPAIYVNSLETGNQKYLQGAGLLFDYRNFAGVRSKAKELMADHNLKENHQKKLKTFLANKINVTAFMVWFVEYYPESKRLVQENKNIQEQFKTKTV